jgi:hypothetical protein
MANTSLPKHASCWIGPLKSGSPISRWTVGYRTHKPTGFCKRGQQEFTSRNFSKSKGRHEAEVSQKDAPMLGLQTFAENVSIVDGPPVRAVGVTFTTRMIIVKLADGSLWVNSPVPVPADMLDRITASGAREIPCCTDQDACVAPGGVARVVSRRRTVGTAPNTQ